MTDLVVGIISGYGWSTSLHNPITKINYHDEGGYTVHQDRFVCSCGAQDLEAQRITLLEQKQRILETGARTLQRLQESGTPSNHFEARLEFAKKANQKALDDNLTTPPCDHWCPSTNMLRTNCPCHNNGCGRVEPFVVSLRRSNYEGRCVLITGNDNTDLDIPAQYGVEKYNAGKFTDHACLVRPRAIIDILEKSKDLRYVLAVDTRDIIFQSNPMIWIEQNIGDHSLVVTSEGSVFCADNEGAIENSKRFVAMYGDEEYQLIKNRPICNGGVVGGTAQTQMEFRKAMQVEIDKFPEGIPEYGPRSAGWPSDQIIMNYLLNREPFRSQTLVAAPQDGFAFHRPHVSLGATVRDNVIYPPNSNVPYPIVHQYLEWSHILWPKYGDDYQIVF